MNDDANENSFSDSSIYRIVTSKETTIKSFEYEIKKNMERIRW